MILLDWVLPVVGVAIIASLALSARVRHGRRENMLAATLRRGCILAPIAALFVTAIGAIAIWLGFEP